MGLLNHAQSVQGVAHASLLNCIAWTYSKLLPCLPRCLPSQAAEALAHIAQHVMPFFCEEHAPVLDNVLHVMETWWLEDRDGKTDVAQSTVEGLIYLCFSSHGKPKDVRRLVNVQDALICCGSSTHIAVQKCLQHPMFTLSPDGRKFLSFAASASVRARHLPAACFCNPLSMSPSHPPFPPPSCSSCLLPARHSSTLSATSCSPRGRRATPTFAPASR